MLTFQLFLFERQVADHPSERQEGYDHYCVYLLLVIMIKF